MANSIERLTSSHSKNKFDQVNTALFTKKKKKKENYSAIFLPERTPLRRATIMIYFLLKNFIVSTSAITQQ